MTLKSTSKLLSYVLRHRPDSIGICLDENGWIDLELLISALRTEGKSVSLEMIKRVVETNDKKRFVIRDGRIRANQGHSIEIELGLPSMEPPESLYHGTALKNLEPIKSNGLVRMNRQHVHLSLDFDTAVDVGRRHGKPVVLKIKSLEMFELGHDFYLSENNVWLVRKVPSQFIEVLEIAT